MCSFVLANWSHLGHLATWSGDPRLGVEHTLGAVAWAQRAGSKLLVSYGLDVAARAYAAVVRRSASGRPDSDHSRCIDSLDQAHNELNRPDGHPGSRLVYFYGDGQYLATRSACLLDLERPARLATGERSVTEINPAFPRNVARKARAGPRPRADRRLERGLRPDRRPLSWPAETAPRDCALAENVIRAG